MDIQRTRAVDALRNLGLKDADSILGEYAQQGPFGAIESGAITPDEFHRQLAARMPPGVSYDDIDRAFIRFLVGIPIHRLDALRRLRKQYRIFLLSNTNPIMWESEIKDQFRQQGLTINDYFDGIVTSFEAKVMKPDPAIFRYAQQKLGLIPEETLFLDDSQDNCDTARRLGFNVALVRPGTEFENLIS